MKKNCLLKKMFFCLCALVAPLAINAADYPSGSPVALNGRLKVDGTQMVNECGTPVQLRGMSTHGPAWNKTTYTEESLGVLVKDWGIDVFRLAIYTHEWGGYTTEQWKTKEAYNQYIDELVDLCAKYGVYCIIDWHVLNQGSGDPNYTLEDAEPFWDYMSNKHKDAKHVIYEICNEPNGNSVTWSVVKQYADVIIPIIRNNDPNAIIVCGTPKWSQDVDEAAKNPLSYDNIMYALHFYSGTHTQYLRDKGQTAINKGLALFVTEFGTTLASGNGGPYLDECDKWMTWMKERKISWCNWSYSDIKESSAALLPGSAAAHNWNNVSASGNYIKSKILESDEFVNCASSVDEVSYNDEVFVYPNPVKDEFLLQVPEGTIVNNIQIVDMMGRCVCSLGGTENKVNVSGLTRGVYFVKITFSDGTSTKRIVKE